MKQPKTGMSLKGLVYLVISLVMVAMFVAAFGHGQRGSKGSSVFIQEHMDGSWDMFIFQPCPGSLHVKKTDKDEPLHVVCERER